MRFIHTFKGYEDKTVQLDHDVNTWIMQHKVNVVDVISVLGHEYQGRNNSGDLLYTVIYEADKPVGM